MAAVLPYFHLILKRIFLLIIYIVSDMWNLPHESDLRFVNSAVYLYIYSFSIRFSKVSF